MFKILIKTDHSKTTILIRLVVGVVFLSEGIQKFLYPVSRGSGRFEEIGLPSAEFLGDFVGSLEIICGILILLGFLTRLASVPLFIIMIVALSSTKVEILIDKGFWEAMHASRTDWAMFLCSLFLLVKGGGLWSLDKILYKHE